MSYESYYKSLLEEMPRLLGLLDTNPSTDIYGCFDREYWHYNTIDIPCARKQEAALTLALLYNLKYKDNIYYKKPIILEWINAVLNFWTKTQSKDGSFNEWYPNEHSFVTTSFSSYAISEALLLMGDKIKNKNKIILSLKKAGNWLRNRYEQRVQNQQAGAAIALFNIYLLTKENKYLKDSEEKINQLIKIQTKEGWWSEYGGPDIGYLSLTIDYLTKYYKKHPNKNLKKVIENALHFISYFIHPDLTAGGCYGSRNTEYLIPSGFEAAYNLSKDAKSISQFIRKSTEKRKTILPNSLDDRYLSYIGYNWLQAFINARENKKIKDKETKPRFQKVFTKNFKIAKIYIKSNEKFYFILNYDKGTFRVFSKGTKKAYNDSGILIEKEDETYITGLSGNVTKFSEKDNHLIMQGYLKKLSKKSLTPSKNISLRLFQLTLGKSERISLNVKEKLRDILITKSKNTKRTFIREFYLYKNSIKVTDRIKGIKSVKKIILGKKFSYLFVPSANYFQRSELSEINTKVIVSMEKDKSIKISRELK